MTRSRSTEQMVTGGWQWRSYWPRSSSRFLVPDFLQGLGRTRVAPRRRSTKKIVSAPEPHHRVQGQPSNVSAKILPETGNAFCNQFFATRENIYNSDFYSPCLRTFYCLDCTFVLLTSCEIVVYFMCMCQSMGIHLRWWGLVTGRSDLQSWVLRQRRPWRGWRSLRWGGARERSRGHPGSLWCRCQSWRLASSRCCWCHSHHNPGYLRAPSEYLARSRTIILLSFICELKCQKVMQGY